MVLGGVASALEPPRGAATLDLFSSLFSPLSLSSSLSSGGLGTPTRSSLCDAPNRLGFPTRFHPTRDACEDLATDEAVTSNIGKVINLSV